MKIERSSSEILLQTPGLDFEELRIADATKLGHILTSGLYADAMAGVIREVLANAWDSHREAARRGKPTLEPIRMHIDTSTQQLIVADFGTGIPPEQVRDVAMALGGSSKDADDYAIGGWGLGFKSPYALSDQWSFENRWNGRVYTYLCALCDERLTVSMSPIVRDTDLVNGVTVRVPIPQGSNAKAYMLARYYTRFFNDDTVSVTVNNAEVPAPSVVENSMLELDTTIDGISLKIREYATADEGSEARPMSPTWVDNVTYYSKKSGSANGTVITIGGIPYVVQDQGLDGLSHAVWQLPLIIDAPVGFCQLTPSRDNIRGSHDTIQRLKKLQEKLAAVVAEEFLVAVKAAKLPAAMANVYDSLKEATIRSIAHERLEAEMRRGTFGPRLGNDQNGDWYKVGAIYAAIAPQQAHTRYVAMKQPAKYYSVTYRSTPPAFVGKGAYSEYSAQDDTIYVILPDGEQKHVTYAKSYQGDYLSAQGGYSASSRITLRRNSIMGLVLDDMGRDVIARVRSVDDERLKRVGARSLVYVTGPTASKSLGPDLARPDYWRQTWGICAENGVIVVAASTLEFDIERLPKNAQPASLTGKATVTAPALQQLGYTPLHGFTDLSDGSPANTLRPGVLDEKKHVYVMTHGNNAEITICGQATLISRNDLHILWMHLWRLQQTLGLNELPYHKPCESRRLIGIQASSSRGNRKTAWANWLSLESIAERIMQAAWERTYRHAPTKYVNITQRHPSALRLDVPPGWAQIWTIARWPHLDTMTTQVDSDRRLLRTAQRMHSLLGDAPSLETDLFRPLSVLQRILTLPLPDEYTKQYTDTAERLRKYIGLALQGYGNLGLSIVSGVPAEARKDFIEKYGFLQKMTTPTATEED